MANDLDSKPEEPKSDEVKIVTSDGKATPPNKFAQQAQPVAEQQVPRSEPEIVGTKSIASPKSSIPNKNNGRKRKRESSKRKYIEKRLKDRESNNEENPIPTRIMASYSDQHKVIDLSQENGSKNEERGWRDNFLSKSYKFSFEEEMRISKSKVKYHTLVLNKKVFLRLVREVIESLWGRSDSIRIKPKAVYFIQKLWEEYLVFYYSQLNEISTFAKHKTVMNQDFDIYNLLISRLLNHDDLAFINDIIKIQKHSRLSNLLNKSSKIRNPTLKMNIKNMKFITHSNLSTNNKFNIVNNILFLIIIFAILFLLFRG